MVDRSEFHFYSLMSDQSSSNMRRLSRRFIWLKQLAFFAFPIVVLLFTSVSTVKNQNFRSTDSGIGLLQYLPPGYHENSDKYPLVIFLHGFVERGVNSNDVVILESTISTVDNFGPPRHVRKGYKFPFIMISPQLKYKYEKWPAAYVHEVVEWAKENLRVDEKRIHITGLSLGGGAAFLATQEYPALFASSAPVCAYWNSPAKAPAIARENVAVWAFHGEDDQQVPLHTTSYMIDSINRCIPPPDPKAKLTVYSESRHDIWDFAYDTSQGESPNLYEWMMSIQKRKNGSNYIPSANAGEDQILNSPGTVILSGSGSDVDGTIEKYHWRKVTGPRAVFANESAATSSVVLARKGTYLFKLTVTDNEGSTDTDFVRIIVK
jgi:hypothetical protein